jgi:hypothetical protein
LISGHGRGGSIVAEENVVLRRLGMTPLYLDARCHEALYEVDVGVNEALYTLDMHPGSHKKERDDELIGNSVR